MNSKSKRLDKRVRVQWKEGEKISSNIQKQQVLAKKKLGYRDICILEDCGSMTAADYVDEFRRWYYKEFNDGTRVIPTALYLECFARKHGIDEDRINRYAEIEKADGLAHQSASNK